MTINITRRTLLAGGLGVASAAVLLDRRVHAAEQAGGGRRTEAKVLVFDTFGTVVDWRSSVIAEGERLGRDKRLTVDWAAFADAWRGGYGPAMNRVRSGELPVIPSARCVDQSGPATRRSSSREPAARR